MIIETTKDLVTLKKMRDATIKHLERLEDIESLEDIRNELVKIEMRIVELEVANLARNLRG